MRLELTNRALSFSQEKQDIIEAAIDLYKHYVYNNNNVDFSMFAEVANKGKSYDEKNTLFNEQFRKQVVKSAYLPEEAVNDKHIFKMKNIRDLSYALVMEILDTILPQTMIESFKTIAEIKTVGNGNQAKFTVPNTHVFDVYKVARGTRKTIPQTDYKGDAFLTPEPRMITIRANFEEILLGKCDWGSMMVKAAQAFEQDMTTEIYTTIAATYSTLGTDFKEAGFTQTAFNKLKARIAAHNKAPVIVMGTQIALSSVLPSNDYFKMELGKEYNAKGFITNFQGTNLMEIPQSITPNTNDFAIADDELYFFSLGVDKPIKAAIEDGGMAFESMDNSATADNSYFYSVRKSWDMGVITSAKYGIMKIA